MPRVLAPSLGEAWPSWFVVSLVVQDDTLPWVGQVWVTGVLGVSQVAGVLGVWGGDRMPTFQFQFQNLNYLFLPQMTA